MQKAPRQRSLATPTNLSADNLVRCSDEELVSYKALFTMPFARFRQLNLRKVYHKAWLTRNKALEEVPIDKKCSENPRCLSSNIFF